jgi:hypothetical protein
MKTKNILANAVSIALAGGALMAGGISTASASTTMYNLYNSNVNGFDSSGNALPCSPCTGSGNGVGGFTDGWVWGLPTAANGYNGPTSSNPDPGFPNWAGTSSPTTTPFNAYTSAVSLNWGFRLFSATDSGQISNADAISRYNQSADIDTAKGAWFDNAASPVGWLHDLDIGLFKSDVTTQVKLDVSGVNYSGTNFGITVFHNMSNNTTGYVHHGSWNASQNGTPTPPGLGFTAADIVATTDTSGAPLNLNELVFNAQAGQFYTIVVGGWRDGAWFDTNDGYKLNVTAVPLPAAVWLFGSAIAGLGLANRRKTT